MQFVGVEHLPGKGDAEVAKRFAAAILLVSGDRMADVGKMDSNLVCSAGQRLDAQVRSVAEALKNAITGERFSSFSGGRDHLLSVMAAAGNMSFDHAGFFSRSSDDDGAVFFVDFTGLKLPCEFVVRHVVLRRDEASGSILIQPVNNAGAERMTAGREFPAVGQQCVDESMRRIADCGMDDETRGLVHDNQLTVFVKDFERDVLGFESGLLWRRKNRLDDVARLDRMVRLDPLPVKGDEALVNEPLNVGPRSFGKKLREKLIQPRASAGFGYDEA